MFSGVLLVFLASTLSLGGLMPSRHSLNSVTLENDSDGFQLVNQEYTQNDSYVFTAVANFERGQACGVIIGGEQDQHYYVFNVDRFENKTKVIHFWYEGDIRKSSELYNEWFIGNDKVTESELNVIKPKVASCNQFNFKVVVTKQDEHCYTEFFLDNIKRFGVDENIDLATEGYSGGKLGFNVFNGKVTFNNINVGSSDYAYYTELYRNQYHYSQYAHWNNDPNGLVYYDGYYHMFYQTHPFTKFWDHMYWGHARSRDLIHWQELPIALFPDDGTMGCGLGIGYAWSGIAMVYHKGMSSTIDGRNWFPNGSGDGLLGFYTRDGNPNDATHVTQEDVRQDQIIISSDDGGMTWTKHDLISQNLVFNAHKIDCRDPSIIPLKKQDGKVTLWGMVLSGGTHNKYWVLKSTDLIYWDKAGEYDYIYPECMTAAKVTADDATSHYILSVSSRYYAVVDFVYNESTHLVDIFLADGRDIRTVPQNEAFKKMEYGEDSYAMQCFYIDDNTNPYYGKSIGLSWYSGLPSDAESGAYAEVRHPWNGGGMTTPVEFGLKKVATGKYNITQKPIIENSDDIERTSLVNVADASFNNESNPLTAVNTHTFELKATISNPNKNSIEFFINSSEGEQTSFGWNQNDGYFFDRSHTNRAGINFQKGYSRKFTTGQVDETELSFYVLSDNGGVELFAGDYQYTFYNLTLSAPYSLSSRLVSGGNITINSLQVNAFESIWHKPSDLEEGILYVDTDDILLDTQLAISKTLSAYSTNGSPIDFAITEGDEHISIERNTNGVTINALSVGTAQISVTSGEDTKVVNVIVNQPNVDSDFEFTKDGIHSGSWCLTSNGLLGVQTSGDGFLFSNVSKDNFTYSASFNMSNSTAAGLLVRASRDMSSYIMANYDKNARVSKIWTPNGVLAQANVNDVNPNSVTLTVKAEGRYIEVYVNSRLSVSTVIKDSDPLSGYFGLNVFAGRVLVDEIHLLKDSYEFKNADLVIDGGTPQYINAIYNFTDRNSLVAKDYYSVNENLITLKKEYFQLLKDNTTYTFFVEGASSSFNFKVETGKITRSLNLSDLVINEGQALNVFVGVIEVTSVSVNGATLDKSNYQIKDYVLHFDGSLFALGNNEVKVNDTSFTVTVNGVKEANETSLNREMLFNINGSSIALVVSLVLLVGIIGSFTFIYVYKRRQHND